MGVKILAGLAAAVAVTAIGVYVAFSGGPDATADPSADVTMADGGCCSATFRHGVCPDSGECPTTAQQPYPTDALAACAGGSAAGLATPEGVAACKAKTACCAD
jgi:hypothetical protein